MKTLFRLIVLVLLLTGWGLAAASLHVVRAKGDAIVLIPKQSLGIQDTYVDARAWTIDDVPNHAPLFERIVQSGKVERFAYVVEDPEGDVTRQIERAIESAPRGDDGSKHNKSATESARKAVKTASAWWELNRR